MELHAQCVVVGSFIAYLILQLIRWIRADSDLTVQWAEWWGKKPGKSPAKFLVSVARSRAQLFRFFCLELAASPFIPPARGRGTVSPGLRAAPRLQQ